MSNESSISDEDAFVIQQNLINEAINKSREALYKPSDVIECIDCGEDIPEERKLKIPSAERCVFCQSLYEKRKSK